MNIIYRIINCLQVTRDWRWW